MSEHYDAIIIGTGAGGGTLAYALAGSGKRIRLLEGGDFLPREMGNWDPAGTSFFPSIGAVNPALTAMASALRVGDHIKSRMA